MKAAILSGCLAAAASGFSKVAFGEWEENWWVAAGALICMLGCNALMMHFFVQAMRDSGSVVGTTVNVGSNVFFSALIGVLCFGEVERITLRWALGASIALLGVYYLSRA